MPTVTPDLPAPVNHIFVDFENVHTIDLEIIGKNAVSFTLLVGPRQTKLDVSLVEKLFQHAVSVELVRLTKTGKNALDFTLAYYVGRAVAGDPTGVFHIVSKDSGYDALIQHLQSRNISAQRHDSFATLPFAAPTLARAPAKPTPPPVARKPKARAEPKTPQFSLDEWAAEVVEHFRKPKATLPKTQKRLLRFLLSHHRRGITETQGLDLIEHLRESGHLTISERAAVTYHL